MVVTLGQNYYLGKKPIVILYTYIYRDAGTPDKTKTKETMNVHYNLLDWAFFMG